ncbi:MAG: diaminopimelate epimerase [Phycisphaerae bacterium]|nr:diaminopimelate epimerase [Phycisphaerae bacterium]
MRFVKMHGIGNDYIYLDAYARPELEARVGSDRGAVIPRLSDRHEGVGGDGVILVCRPRVPGAHVRMRMFNADGGEAEMCGNGVRCVAKFAHDRLGLHHSPLLVETGRGVLRVDCRIEHGRLREATVDMGPPELNLARIGVDESRLTRRGQLSHYAFETGIGPGSVWVGVFVSMGNPHVVLFETENRQISSVGLEHLNLTQIGPFIERHPAFVNRINAHFVRVRTRALADMRSWERGTGETRACGTGACAACVAGVISGTLDPEATLRLPGGDLRVSWSGGESTVRMTGPAEESFVGEFPDEWLEPGAPRGPASASDASR